jgi:hypothetical protein
MLPRVWPHASLEMPAPRASVALAVGAAALWALTCVRWFDDGAPFRPAWLEAVPPALPFALTLAAAALWLRRERAALGGEDLDARALWIVVLLALVVRLPLAWGAAAGYLTSDGALSGIVALRLRDAREHFVFVPAVPYSGSLKSHLAAPLALLFDPARAFALASLAFFAAAVAAAFRLAWRAGGPFAAWGAGLYLTLAPAFVTQYSLSNDGNYVEVLALGPWALLLALRAGEAARPWPARFVAGVLLGLAFWCHILALVPGLALAVVLLRQGGWRALPSALGPTAAGAVVGWLPALLWNAGHGWESLRYLVPGLQPVGESARSPLGERLAGLLADHAPILSGYAGGPTPALDALAWGLAWIAAIGAVGALLLGLADAARTSPAARETRLALGWLCAANVMVALLALPYLPGNPRYLLFLATPLAVFLGCAAARLRFGALTLGALIVFGALGTFDQARAKLASERDWRTLAAGVEAAGVRHCYSDFYVGTKLNFLTEERVICSAKLGPTLTEYFFEYRRQVDRAPAAAYVATSWAQARKLQRRLARVGVAQHTLPLPKPVLLPARKVDPAELFPGRAFPMR